MNLNKGTAFILGIIIGIIIIVAYSYFFLHSFTAGFFQFVTLFTQAPIPSAILIIIGLIIGYLLGKAY